MHAATRFLSATSGLVAIALCSCGLEKSGTRPEPTRFLQSTGVDVSRRIARLPFEHAWRDPSVDLTKYKHIVIRPVTTGFLRSEQWENSKSALIPNKRAYQSRCDALARHWTKSLDKAYSSPDCMFYKIRLMSAEKTSLTQLNEAICDEWSQQLMQRSNIELFPTVKRSWLSIF